MLRYVSKDKKKKKKKKKKKRREREVPAVAQKKQI